MKTLKTIFTFLFLWFSFTACAQNTNSKATPVSCEEIKPFNNGVAWAKWDEKWGVIGKDYVPLIAAQFDSIPFPCFFVETFERDHNGTTESVLTIVDISTNTILTSEESRSRFDDDVLKQWRQSKYDNEHPLRPEDKDGKYGYVDKQGNVVVNHHFSWATEFKNGYSLYYTSTPISREWGYVNDKGVTVSIPYQIVGIIGHDEKVIIVENDNREYGMTDMKGVLIVPFGRYSFGPEGSGDFIGVESVQDEKFGIIDFQGNLIIPCVYNGIEFIQKSDNQSFQQLAYVEKDSEIGILDSKGEELIPIGRYQLIKYVRSANLFLVGTEDERYGIVSLSGNEIIPCSSKYEDESLIPILQHILAIQDANGDYEIFDYKLKKLLPTTYQYIEVYDNGLVKTYCGNKVGLINSVGEEIFPCTYDYLAIYVHENSYAFPFGAIQIDNKIGYIYKTGEYVLFNEEDIQNAVQGVLEPISIEQDGKYRWGIVDDSGNEVIAPQYEMIYYFTENMPVVQINGKLGIINNTGEEIIPIQYDYVVCFSEGLAAVKLNDKWGFFDKQGEQVIPFQYDEISLINGEGGFALGGFKKGFAAVKLDGKWGYINKSGEEVIPFVYDDAKSFENGKAEVSRGGVNFAIEKSGKRIN